MKIMVHKSYLESSDETIKKPRSRFKLSFENLGFLQITIKNYSRTVIVQSRQFCANPTALRFAAGGICLKIAPLSLRNSILRLRLGGQSVETIYDSAMLL